MRRLFTVTVTAIVGIGLSACSAADTDAETTPTPTGVASELVPGACVIASGEPTVLGDTAVTEEAIVDCAEEHLYEVLAAQDIPGQYLLGTEASEDDLARLGAALDGSRTDPVQIRFAAFASAYCDIALQRAVGIDPDDHEMAGVDVAALKTTPITHSSAPRAVLREENWTEQPSMLCVNRFVASTPDPAQAPAITVSGAQTPLLMTSELPVAQRLCFSFDATGVPADTSCEAPHDAEYTVAFDATALLDDEQLAEASGDAAAPFADDVQELLDGACQDALGFAIGDDHDEAIIGAALRGAEGWGAGGLANTVNCFATPADADQALPAGSVFGLGDATVELVARG